MTAGYWNLFRFNPQLADEGKNPFILESKEPKTEDYRKFMMGEARYSALTRSFPDRAEGLFERSEVEFYQALRSPEAPAGSVRSRGVRSRKTLAEIA